MKEIQGWIPTGPHFEPALHNARPTMQEAWRLICNDKDRDTSKARGWRVVPCKLVIEDDKP